MESVLCVLLLPKCPWHKNKEEEDRRHDLLTVPQTCRALPRARCPYQSLKQQSPCSSPLLNCTLPPTDLTVCTVVMACLASFLLDNIRFLPDEPHETWHLSLTWNRLPAEAHHSHRQPCQAGFFLFFGFCFVFFTRLAGAPGSWPVSNLTNMAHQKGKAVITNKLLLVNLCQTMWSDQCVARNKDNIITVWQQSSGLCSSRGFSLASPAPHSFLTYTLLIKHWKLGSVRTILHLRPEHFWDLKCLLFCLLLEKSTSHSERRPCVSDQIQGDASHWSTHRLATYFSDLQGFLLSADHNWYRFKIMKPNKHTHTYIFTKPHQQHTLV